MLPDNSQEAPASRRRWLKGAIVALPVAATAMWAAWFLQRPVYTATAILRLASTDSKLLFDTADNQPHDPDAFKMYASSPETMG